MSWTIAQDKEWAMAGVAIRPAPGSARLRESLPTHRERIAEEPVLDNSVSPAGAAGIDVNPVVRADIRSTGIIVFDTADLDFVGAQYSLDPLGAVILNNRHRQDEHYHVRGPSSVGCRSIHDDPDDYRGKKQNLRESAPICVHSFQGGRPWRARVTPKG